MPRRSPWPGHLRLAADLRRLAIAHACSTVGYWGTTIAVLVYAYERGGSGLVGIAAFVRVMPVALASPFAGALADRHPRERVLVVGDLLRVVTLACAAVAVAAAAPAALVLALIAVNAALFASFRPALRALTAARARDANELVAANLVAAAIDSAGMFAGPALGGALMAAAGASAVFAAAAGTLAVSAALVAGLQPGRSRVAPRRAPARSLRAQLSEGVRAVKDDRSLRLIVGLTAGQTASYGALSVLIVGLVTGVLRAEHDWVGYLNAAVGLGGVAGALALARLIGSRLGRAAALGITLWGLALCAIGLRPGLTTALVALACIGVANVLVDVSLNTLLQRAAPAELHARIFALLGLVGMGTIAFGGLLAPLLAALVGTRGAFVAVGVALVALAARSSAALRDLDAACRQADDSGRTSRRRVELADLADQPARDRQQPARGALIGPPRRVRRDRRQRAWEMTYDDAVACSTRSVQLPLRRSSTSSTRPWLSSARRW